MNRRGRWEKRRVPSVLIGVLLSVVFAPHHAAATTEGQPYVEMASFLLDGQLTDIERRRILEDAARRRAADPERFEQEMTTLQQAMAQVASAASSGPVVRAALRDQLYATLFLETVQAPTEEVPEALRIVFERIPVVAANPAAGLVVDARDVDAFFAMDRFIAQLAGVEPSFSEQARPLFEEYARQLVNSGDAVAAQLAQFSVTWEQVRVAWSQLPPATQQAIAANMRAQVQQSMAMGQLPPPPADLANGPMTMDEFGAAMSRNHLFNNIFLDNFRAMYD